MLKRRANRRAPPQPAVRRRVGLLAPRAAASPTVDTTTAAAWRRAPCPAERERAALEHYEQLGRQAHPVCQAPRLPPGTYRGAIAAARTRGKLPLVCRCEEPDCICASARQPPPAALSEANMQKARAAGMEQHGSAQPCASAAPKRHLAAIVADSGLGLVALHNIKKEPGQEPSAANRQQHDIVKDSDQAAADLADLADPAGAMAAHAPNLIPTSPPSTPVAPPCVHTHTSAHPHAHASSSSSGR